MYRQRLTILTKSIHHNVCGVKLNKNEFIRRASSTLPKQIFTVEKEKSSNFSNTDPDVFGTLANKVNINQVLDALPEEEDDKIVIEKEDKKGKRIKRSVESWAEEIKKLVKERRIVDAIDVVETKMAHYHVKPNYYIYNLLISACGKEGYSKKAFSLYNKMKKHGIKITPATYTGLFNACANSPFQNDCQERANHLREIIEEKRYEPNLINYHAMIKAFSRCNDISTAFTLVDEMMAKGFTLTNETFSFVLQACISDKEAGFRHCILVWRKMIDKRVPPTIHSYNLLLRCVRDCGIGDAVEAHRLLEQVTKKSVPLVTSKLSQNADDECGKENEKEDCNGISVIDKMNEAELNSKPNLISKIPRLGNIIGLNEVKTAQDRLLLLGGFKSVLHEMDWDKVVPNIKTFTLLMDAIPCTTLAEESLLEEMNKRGVVMDIDFYNMLIKKRSMRFDYDGAKKVLQLIQSSYLNPDIVTFGVLALGCLRKTEAERLVQDMNEFGYRLNMEILGAMLRQGCAHVRFNYIMYIMQLCERFNINPNEKFMNHLTEFKKRMKELDRKKKRKERDVPDMVKQEWFVEGYRMFNDYYQQWIQRVHVEKQQHPWKQFEKAKESSNDEPIETDKSINWKLSDSNSKSSPNA